MIVTLPDEIIAPYLAYAESQGCPLADILAAQLKRFTAFEPGKKAIVIPAKLEGVLADKLGGLPIASGPDLIARLTRLAGISFAGHDLSLTPNQLAELQHRAERQGRSVAELVDDIWRRLSNDFFYSSGGGEAKPPKAVSHPTA